jgi:WD and tetratricopeptide repeat-containing protein 1
MTEISGKESEWREAARDYDLRFYGHCNTTTDIKEANFFGRYLRFIEVIHLFLLSVKL